MADCGGAVTIYPICARVHEWLIVCCCKEYKHISSSIMQLIEIFNVLVSLLLLCDHIQIASFKDEERTVTYSSAVHYFDGFHEWSEEASCEVSVVLADDNKALIPMGNAIDNLIKVGAKYE